MKHLILLFTMLIACTSILAIQKEESDYVRWKGGWRPVNVNVTIQQNTVTTTFLKETRNTTVTVKKKSGEVVQRESLNAKTFDQVSVKLDNYQKGDYIIEIETEEGKAEGEF